MNKNTILIGIIIIIIILIVAGVYTVAQNNEVDTEIITNESLITSGENPEPGSSVHDLPVEPAAAVARKDLATKLSVDEKSIVILKITDMTWTDGCLGLGQAHESCMQALVSGFKVEMIAEGKIYIYRTDKTGTSIRSETQL